MQEPLGALPFLSPTSPDKSSEKIEIAGRLPTLSPRLSTSTQPSMAQQSQMPNKNPNNSRNSQHVVDIYGLNHQGDSQIKSEDEWIIEQKLSRRIIDDFGMPTEPLHKSFSMTPDEGMDLTLQFLNSTTSIEDTSIGTSETPRKPLTLVTTLLPESTASEISAEVVASIAEIEARPRRVSGSSIPPGQRRRRSSHSSVCSESEYRDQYALENGKPAKRKMSVVMVGGNSATELGAAGMKSPTNRQKRADLMRNKSDVNLLVDAFQKSNRKQSFVSAKGQLSADIPDIGFDDMETLASPSPKHAASSRPLGLHPSLYLKHDISEKSEAEVLRKITGVVTLPDDIPMNVLWWAFSDVCVQVFIVSSILVSQNGEGLEMPVAVTFGLVFLLNLSLGIFQKGDKIGQSKRQTSILKALVFLNIVLPCLGYFWISTTTLLCTTPGCSSNVLMYVFRAWDLSALWRIPLLFTVFAPKTAKKFAIIHFGIFNVAGVVLLILVFGSGTPEQNVQIYTHIVSTDLLIIFGGGLALKLMSRYYATKETLGALENHIDTLKVRGHSLMVQYKEKKMLLRKLLPSHIEKTLNANEIVKTNKELAAPVGISDEYRSVTILFCDLVGFTTWSAELTPDDLVSLLSGLFSVFDMLSEKYGVEKIKTIGDCYMVAGGIPVTRKDHAERVVSMGRDMMEAVSRFCRPHTTIPLVARIGVHSGSLIAAVIGIKRLSYDVFGDTVNMASRMESSGIPGKIQISQSTFDLVKHKFDCTKRVGVAIKGKGLVDAYIVNGVIGGDDEMMDQLDSTLNTVGQRARQNSEGMLYSGPRLDATNRYNTFSGRPSAAGSVSSFKTR